ncbi:hypothetical protein B0H15DRAFT_958445 [Mycena belliarum]|uniref:Chromo domain-containing protein n=1 Tax=Mycena belliarum TaxID=1033014 RepID=A0AAD6TQV4_9AGAR|nr:hypothetical protein B0H15DRAFT_958445 [Mycena belliae]
MIPALPADRDDEEGDEYEIEAILDARKDTATNRLGYLVKWKNYSDTHNSWVDEEDAVNAPDLIKAFWMNQSQRIAAGVQSVSAPVREATGEAEASGSTAKKRGRSSRVKVQKDRDSAPPPAKKARKSTGEKNDSS